MSDNPKRNIVFFGETGTGKSSAINLLLKTTAAHVTNDSQPCTQVNASYEVVLNDSRYTLWDTRGLGGAFRLLRYIFRFGASSSSEKELKKFLKERHQRNEIDLLVYCVRGSRATSALVKYYNTFCSLIRDLAVPVVIMVTHLEREVNMEDWWYRNSSALRKHKMEFDDHVCITTLVGHARASESRSKLIDLITSWNAKCSGPFGFPVQSPTPSASTPTSRVVAPSRPESKQGSDVDDGNSIRRSSNRQRTSSAAASTRHSSYFTAETPGSSVPPSPIVEPLTPCSETRTIRAPRPDTYFFGINGILPTVEETPTGGYPLSRYSVSAGSQSSNTSHSEPHFQPSTEDPEDFLINELPFEHSTATVVRRKKFPVVQGFFGDIWECDLTSGESSRMVAVKVVKTGTNSHGDLKSHRRKLRRELRVWGRLRHRNIVPLLGIVSDFGPLPSMISKSRRHHLLEDITAGLCYLHGNEVVHGDLHSDNVLIDDDGRACLTDFGLSFAKEFVGTSYLISSICGGVHFADPALVRRVGASPDQVFYPTKPCDVYSFGGLTLHVMSGKKPYAGLPATTVCAKVSEGERPQIPADDKTITPWHKSLIRRCWDPEERIRPSASDLVKMFALAR